MQIYAGLLPTERGGVGRFAVREGSLVGVAGRNSWAKVAGNEPKVPEISLFNSCV